MPGKVSFTSVSTEGLENSPHADALAGLRANEARYFWNKYKHEFTTYSAAEVPQVVEYVSQVLLERDITILARPLEATIFQVDNISWAHVFYESGLAVNVLYEMGEEKPKRAVGFKLSAGMDVPAELADKFKFARQRSKLAGEIRGSYFVVKREYEQPAI